MERWDLAQEVSTSSEGFNRIGAAPAKDSTDSKAPAKKEEEPEKEEEVDMGGLFGDDEY